MRYLMLSLLCLLLTSTGLSSAADNKPFAALPGGQLIFKPVQSVRERRFHNLVEQKTDFSCGAAAVATLLQQAYGRDVDEAEVINGMLKLADAELVQQQGFSMLDMKHYAASLGMRARGYRLRADQLHQVSIPTIVLMEIRGYKHFVVLQRASREHVYIGDPALGHQRYSLDTFTKGWNGIVFALIGQGYDRNNALLSPPEPLTARDRLNRFQPVEDAQLVEFGFLHSDLF
ncbi:C39 family peptidase [Atopomonas sediminilitoris]|uniref:C39 family peptidase n=1 Tax=Atopomonas sediminilitoris TaxID=2919919 RepID=UPI001F4DBE2D|nr:C39 family peptidase [Atopomonas sediminilitoris]MCJ8167756.1 C39 family peptidase [Atopomonas sediminilitoris]